MLTLLRNDENKRGYGIYRCVCGTEKSIRKTAVTSGGTKSCGCHRKETAKRNGKMATTHGMTNTPIYTKWATLKCDGLLCEKWQSFEPFYNHIKDDWNNGLTGILIKDGFTELSPDSIVLTTALESKRLNTTKTNLAKYGVLHHTQSPIVKNKILQTNFNKYGGNPNSTPAVQDKIRQTCLRKYGETHYSKTKDGKEKARSKYRIHEGMSGTDLAKDVGTSNSFMNQLIKKYGFEYAREYKKGSTFIEKQVKSILDELGITYSCNTKIGDKFADFVLPDHKVIIETDGLYWHSDAVNEDNRYHINKRFLYSSLGYRPLFFREDEIHDNLEAVRSIITNAVKKCKVLYARKCEIVQLNLKESADFFNVNHIMKKGRGGVFALQVDGKTVCAMQYVVRASYVDISRFCTLSGYSVVGGFSRLIKKIEQETCADIIQTFVDMRYGTGAYLNELGFIKESEHISFKWTKGRKTVHRMKFRGNSGYEHKYNKIWDCGQAKFIKHVK